MNNSPYREKAFTMKDNESQEPKMSLWQRAKDWITFERIFFPLISLAVVVPIGMLAWTLAYQIFADHTAQYCYVQKADKQDLNQTALIAYRGWGFTTTVGVFNSVDETLAVAKKLNCNIKQ